MLINLSQKTFFVKHKYLCWADIDHGTFQYKSQYFFKFIMEALAVLKYILFSCPAVKRPHYMQVRNIVKN